MCCCPSFVVTPEELKGRLRVDDQTHELIRRTRHTIENILSDSTDDRLLIVVGPCSIHNTSAAILYCKALASLRQQFAGTLEIIMRAYTEKPRTTVGWKGLSNDPYLDGSYDIGSGLEATRRLMIQTTSLGIPIGTECLNPLQTKYVDDLLCWGSVGARTTESQVHREMVSGCKFPFGFKNSTDGSLNAAINSIIASSVPQSFLSSDSSGKLARTTTAGNKGCHLVLRGGIRPNYSVSSVRRAMTTQTYNRLNHKLIIDVSHSNSQKDFRRQELICEGIAERHAKGECGIGGVMIESNLTEGRQDIGPHPQPDKSITDACIGWDKTVGLLTKLADAVLTRRKDAV